MSSAPVLWWCNSLEATVPSGIGATILTLISFFEDGNYLSGVELS